ncbi:dCMP deaminase family protein [Patescibacteria group bacterium]|nr:dCMP deaminase family protein [Patescibacteria group bacterium]
MSEKNKDYLSWDECFMQIAYVISQRSKDPSTQAGAVIVDENNVVVGLGYNGFPRNCSDDKLPWTREGDFLNSKYAYVVHAEENAVYNANKPTTGCKVYTSLFPCNECAKTLIQCGINEIIFASDKYHDNDEWVASRKLLDLAGVKYRHYIPKLKINFEKNE